MSHFSGKNAIAGSVSYDVRGKVKDLYRIYNISKPNHGNDIASLKEVLKRRFGKTRKENRNLPSLILIDGGGTHLKAAREVLDRLKYDDIFLLAISKGARRKPEMDTIHIEDGTKLSLQKDSAVRLFFQEIRDETHRF